MGEVFVDKQSAKLIPPCIASYDPSSSEILRLPASPPSPSSAAAGYVASMHESHFPLP